MAKLSETDTCMNMQGQLRRGGGVKIHVARGNHSGLTASGRVSCSSWKNLEEDLIIGLNLIQYRGLRS